MNYTTQMAGKLLGVTPETITLWIRRGTIQAYKIKGTRKWIIPEEEIPAYARNK